MKAVCCHHEGACSYAAEAYAKIKGIPGAVMLTSGPGSTNGISGLLEAYQNSIPVIFISSQSKLKQMTKFSKAKVRQFGVQEMDIISVVRPLCKYASYVVHPEDIRYQMEKAYYEMLNGRPGPVWLDIPQDIASANVPKQLYPYSGNKYELNKYFFKEDEKDFMDMLKASSQPLIIAGGGIRLAKGVDIFKKFVNKFKIPVVSTVMGIDALEYDNPYYVGHGGTKGQRCANKVVRRADLIISIGSRLAVPFIGHDYEGWSPKSKKIVIDVDLQEHCKETLKIDKFINTDLKYFLEQIIHNEPKPFNSWIWECQAFKKKYPTSYDYGKKEVSMYKLVDEIGKIAPDNTIFITDAGSTFFATAQALKIRGEQRAVIAGGTSAMGYNLPAVIGSWFGDKKPIICITGDGSFQMHLSELQTIVHHKIPAKIFITNNEGYLAIRTTQKNFFEKRLIGEGIKSGISFPSTKKIADAYGIQYFKIKNNKQLKLFLPIIMKTKETVIVEVMCPKWEQIVTVSNKKLPNGKMVSLPIDEMAPFHEDKTD